MILLITILLQTTVTAPAGFSYSVPFTISETAGVYSVDPAFDMLTYGGISQTKAYHCNSVTGCDNNDGLTPQTAFRTLKRAQEQPDVDVIYLEGYFYRNERVGHNTRDVNMVSLTGASITSDVGNTLLFVKGGNPQGWDGGAYPNVYRSPSIEHVARAYDVTNLVVSVPQRIDVKTTIQDVNDAPNSMWFDTSTQLLYVRTHDDRAPDADCQFLDNLAWSPTRDTQTTYFENITFVGNLRIRPATSVGGVQAYFKNCEFIALNAVGVDEIILQNCGSTRAFKGDKVNLDEHLGVTTYYAEIDCTFTNTIDDPTGQASTGHAAVGVRVNGAYAATSGQVIADVGLGQSWLVGVHAGQSAIGVSMHFDGEAWLDGCISQFNPTQIQVTDAGSVTIRKEFRSQ